MEALLEGFMAFTWQQGVMIAVGLVLIILAITKHYEPLLLMPIGFGCILANIPMSAALGEHGFLTVLYKAGIENELFPILIFIAVGAMIDFAQLFRRPVMMFFGGAAQFGIFFAMLVAVCINYIWPGMFDLKHAAAIGIIGAVDGPTSIYVGNLFAKDMLGPIMVCAYSYMALVPIIQPPVIRALTTKQERMIRMEANFDEKPIPKIIKVGFPIVITLLVGTLAPKSVGLVGSLMFGNLLRECGVVDSLSKTAQNELGNIVTLLLGITIGSTMVAEQFIQWQTVLILGIGLLAFVFDTVGGVLFAKFINLFLKKKLNPMIGACGISAFPMSARVIQRMAQKEDPTNFILMPAITVNVSGQVASIIAGSLILALLS